MCVGVGHWIVVMLRGGKAGGRRGAGEGEGVLVYRTMYGGIEVGITLGRWGG